MGIDWKIGPECEPELIRSQKSMSESPPPGVVEVRQAEVVAVLVREDADAGVLGLDDVVGQLQVGAGDLRAAGTADECAQMA